MRMLKSQGWWHVNLCLYTRLENIYSGVLCNHNRIIVLRERKTVLEYRGYNAVLRDEEELQASISPGAGWAWFTPTYVFAPTAMAAELGKGQSFLHAAPVGSQEFYG